MSVDKRKQFCDEVNQFLYNRGYDNSCKYVTPDYVSDTSPYIWFYYDRLITCKTHPNKKILITYTKKTSTQYVIWLIELIKPIMDKYNITKEQIV